MQRRSTYPTLTPRTSRSGREVRLFPLSRFQPLPVCTKSHLSESNGQQRHGPGAEAWVGQQRHGLDSRGMGRVQGHGPDAGAWAGCRGMGRMQGHGPDVEAWAGCRGMGRMQRHGPGANKNKLVSHNCVTGLRSRSQSSVFLCGVGVGFLKTLRVGVGFSYPTLTLSVPIKSFFTPHSYVRNPNSSLLKWHNFFWNFCWNRAFLLSTTISIDFNIQTSFPLCWGVGVGNFGKVVIGVRHFTSDSATLLHKQNSRHVCAAPSHVCAK